MRGRSGANTCPASAGPYRRRVSSDELSQRHPGVASHAPSPERRPLRPVRSLSPFRDLPTGRSDWRHRAAQARRRRGSASLRTRSPARPPGARFFRRDIGMTPDRHRCPSAGTRAETTGSPTRGAPRRTCRSAPRPHGRSRGCTAYGLRRCELAGERYRLMEGIARLPVHLNPDCRA